MRAAGWAAIAAMFVLGSGAAPARTQTPTQAPARCRAPAQPLSVKVAGQPFAGISTTDDCWVFAGLFGKTPGVAVLQNVDGTFVTRRTVSLPGYAAGLALTPDGNLLLAVVEDGVAVLDVGRLERGEPQAQLGHFRLGRGAGPLLVAVSPDGRFAFVTSEWEDRLSVIDLAKAHAAGFGEQPIERHLSLDQAPVGVAVSPDGRWVYVTSEAAEGGAPRECLPENNPSGRPHPQGTLSVIDAAEAEAASGRVALISHAAGCNPVRVVVSPDGGRVFVTARGSGAVAVFDAAKLGQKGGAPLLRAWRMGHSPVGLAVSPDGKQLLVGETDRFLGARGTSALILFAVGGPTELKPLATLNAGTFPREIHWSADGTMVVVADFGADAVQILPSPEGDGAITVPKAGS